ncbi:TRAP transporter small permease [Salinimonas sediminis]|uniref:TRAP transporter small permease protein n=1 Tax=Salinimonas sediminis TaxID=2303538 RepID=A0A346NRC2_9ALTE|nr:TRAP transporter small permease [Salinimonas sediminis]AXR08079.1 TRAP transporter small permease [Salinimonas sediminis]
MKLLNQIERLLCVILLAAIVGLVFMAAIMRTFGVPVIWSVDVAQMLFAWLAMLAADQTFKHSEHAAVDIITRRLQPRAQQAFSNLFDILMISVLGLLLWFGIVLFGANPDRTLGSTSISYQWVTLAVPVGAALMIITLLQRLLSRHRISQGQAGL